MSFPYHQDELDFLAANGFATNPLNSTSDSLEEIWQKREDLYAQREDLNYPIDGLVVKLNDNELVEALGVVGKTNRGWAAIKFDADEVTTKVLAVTWQVGRTGKVTPVAELEPVQLQGTTVKRATLHNYKNVVDLDLEIGDFVVVRKAGDIIPEVLKVVKV
jgi:DNA ligase (NAD+)